MLSDPGNRFASLEEAIYWAINDPPSIVWKMKEPLPGFVMKKTVKVRNILKLKPKVIHG